MFGNDYEWIMDFVSTNDEEFKNAVFEMMKTLPKRAFSALRNSKKFHVDGVNTNVQYGVVNDEDGAEMVLMVENDTDRYTLNVRKLSEEKLDELTEAKGEYNLINFCCICDYGDATEFKIKLNLNNQDDAYIVSTEIVNDEVVDERVYPIDYLDIVEGVSREPVTKKNKR